MVIGLFLGLRAFDEVREEREEAKIQRESNELVEDLARVPRGFVDVEDDEDYTMAISLGALASVTVLSGVIFLAASRDDG